MNKKKIIAIISVVVLIAVAFIGMSLAYFTDTDDATNVFTSGNVEIQLNEEFDPDEAKLVPAVITDDGVENAVTKEITVENIGTEDAYVRVHIAVPAILEDYLELVVDDDTDWVWSDDTYDVEIDGIDYIVYVATYPDAMEPDEETSTNALEEVYLVPATTNEDIEEITEELGVEWNIIVVAEGAQAAGFEDADTALNTAFGIPGEYDIDWPSSDDLQPLDP